MTKASEGRTQAHQCFVLGQLLAQIDSLEETIDRFNEQIETYDRPFEEAVILLDTIPGVGRETTVVIVSEIGLVIFFKTARTVIVPNLVSRV